MAVWPKCSLCRRNMRYSVVKQMFWCSTCDHDPPGLSPALGGEDEEEGDGWWFIRIFR